MSLLDRYCAGEHLRVYAELVRQPKHPEAAAVATEIVRRVRVNLETLAERWRARGFELPAPVGKAGSQRAALERIEESYGKLPAVLRAFYETVGRVDFVEEPAGDEDDEWPEVAQFDPIQVFDLESQLERLCDDEDADDDDDDDEGSEPQLVICDDHLIKFELGGVGPIYVPLPAKGFDPELHFEGDVVSDEMGPRFVEYLRITILERGGMGPAGGDDALSRGLVKALVKDLLPF